VKTLDGHLAVDQSAITGESENIQKDVGTDIYSGSIIKKGEALAIVTNTGVNTFFGKTVSLVSTSAPELHVESIIQKIIWSLLIMVAIMLVVAIIIFVAVQKQDILNVSFAIFSP
jgi:H+-transporting ATPase